MATELLLRGVDLSFAPVLDLDIESCVIGDRSFSPDPAIVAELGRHYVAAVHDAGMKVCGKHFPGHGSVRADSHTDEVIDERGFTALEKTDLAPFVSLLGELDSLMMAHVIYAGVDAAPAGYSRTWMKDRLRGELGFRGTIFSDDLGMHAAGFVGKLPERVIRSLEAGCDAVLVCDPGDVAELLSVTDDAPAEAGRALQRLMGRTMISEDELSQVAEWRHWQQSLQELEHSKWA